MQGFKTFESFDKPYKEQNFKMICEDLENYKNNRYKHTYYKSIECDIENYLYMKLLDRKTKYNSFVDKNYYFITADHTLIDWSKEQMPGAIPTFVLPSVWYSLMLKYSGRTDDDYGAFCQFLKLSTTYGLEETKEQQEQKIKMLAYILEINEKIDIKEQIIFDIGQRLSHEGNKEIGDIEEFVEESHQNIVEKEVNKAVKAKEQEHQADKKQIEYQHQEALEQQHQEGREEGIREARKKAAQAIVQRNKKIRRGTFTLAGVLVIICMVGIVAYLAPLYCDESKTEMKIFSFFSQHDMELSIIGGLGSILLIIIQQITKDTPLLSTNIEIVEKHLEKRWEKAKM